MKVHECQAMRQELGKWLAELPKPIGVLGGNDDWAHRVLIAAHRNNIKVPDEMAVMGVDDDELFNTLVTPSLSSIAIPAEQVGYEAAAMLDRMMDGHKPKRDPMLLQPVRDGRAGVDGCADDQRSGGGAGAAVHPRSSSEPLQVDDVMDAVPMSRRSLERRFRTLVGHSISDEIRRAHVERAKQLLLSTDMAMPQIAAASGFTSGTRLGIVFLREVGEPPTEYRRRVRAGGGAEEGAGVKCFSPSPSGRGAG